MRKVYFTSLFFLLILSGIFVLPLHALDLGLYASISGTSGTIEGYDDSEDYDTEDQSGSGGGFGFIINGHLGDDLLINRFMMMYEYNYIETDSWSYDKEYDIESMSLYDTLGFVLTSSQSTSIWLGPQLGIRFLSAADEYDTEYDGIGVSIGAVFGVDFSLNETILLGIEGGLRISGANIESSDYGAGADIYSTEGFLGLALMVKI